MSTINIHIMRIDGVNHATMTTRSNPNRSTHTICGLRLDGAQHRPGGFPHSVLTCPQDIDAVNAMADLMD
jgi:hypothetical protein